jgi:hypothetical protein
MDLPFIPVESGGLAWLVAREAPLVAARRQLPFGTSVLAIASIFLRTTTYHRVRCHVLHVCDDIFNDPLQSEEFSLSLVDTWLTSRC